MTQSIDFNELFNDSYDYIREHRDDFYNNFYTNFLNSSYLIQHVFRDSDINIQKKMLEKAIVHMINFLVTKVANEQMIQLAQKHAAISITSDLYDLFLHAFLKTLSETYPRFNHECGIAWRVTLTPGLEFMKHYSDMNDVIRTES